MAQLGLVGGGTALVGYNGGAGTYYVPLAASFAAVFSVEARTAVPAATTFTATQLSLNISTNTYTSPSTLTFRNAGANGNETLTVPASTTGQFTDSTHTDTVSAGALYNLSWVSNPALQAGIGAFATVSTASQIGLDLVGDAANTYNATAYLQFASAFSNASADTTSALNALESATLSGLMTFFQTNAATSAGSFVSRINAVNGAQTITIPATTTGFFQDTTHTDAITAGAAFNARYVPGTSPNGIIDIYSVHYAGGTSNTVPAYSGYSFVGIAAPGRTWGLKGTAGIPGAPGDTGAAEVQAATIIPTAGALRLMTAGITTNTAGGATPISLHVANGATLTQALSIPASTTGSVQDTTHTDATVAGGLYCYVGMTSASVTRAWSAIFFLASVPTPAAGAITTRTVVAGKGSLLRPEPFTILARTAIAGRTAVQVQSQGTIVTHTTVAGAGRLAKQATGTIITHTTVAGAGLTAGQAVGRIVTHTTVAGITAATAASSFQIATATAVAGAGVSIWDWRQTVISQYANSPSLLRLIEAFALDLNQNTNFQAFYDQVWNIDTAVGWGLDVWGRIVGVSRVLTISTEAYFSFQQAHNIGPGDPFGGGAFFSGEDATANFNLSDDAFRQLILAKAAANICDGSIHAINSILMALFSELGNCYCTDNGNMQMTYTFSQPLNPVQYAIITESGVLPKPVGVAASIVQL